MTSSSNNESENGIEYAASNWYDHICGDLIATKEHNERLADDARDLTDRVRTLESKISCVVFLFGNALFTLLLVGTINLQYYNR